MRVTSAARSWWSVATTWSAPASRRAVALSPLRVVAIETAPRWRAICSAARPTLLDAAVTITVWPARRPPTSTRPPHAVRYCIQIEVASSKDSRSGWRVTACTGTTAWSP